MIMWVGLGLALYTSTPLATSTPEQAVTIAVAGGLFIMGSDIGADDERPVRPVEIKAFRIDATEVTNARYQRCVDAGVCKAPVLQSSKSRGDYFRNTETSDYPVIFVSWEQAQAFCGFVGGRLPTEAEWEKAARGPSPSINIYPWGNAAPTCDHANFADCIGDTDPVGARPLGQSPYGVMDMAGNVWEWVSDWYDGRYYATAPDRDPAGPADGALKVMRGGCWESGADSLRVSCRKAELPLAWADNVGFRCAYDVEVTP